MRHPSPIVSVALALALATLAIAPQTPHAAPKRTAVAKKPTPGIPGDAWISLADLKKSLVGRAPGTVVFDIDDTAVYSTFAFLYAQGMFDGPTRGTSFRNPAFWTMINDSLEGRWSRPKVIADTLITWHLSRGDTVAFVTGRNASTPPSDRTAQWLKRVFRMPALPTVVFTDQKPKVDAMTSLRPMISYGDSDGDIRDSWAADSTIRCIRIVRGPYSSNSSPSKPGSQGEEILIGSAD